MNCSCISVGADLVHVMKLWVNFTPEEKEVHIILSVLGMVSCQ